MSDTKSPNKGDKRKKDKPFKKKKKEDLKCLLCDGPHFVHKCPKKKALYAMKKTSSKKGSEGNSFESEEGGQLKSLQLLGAISKKNAKMEEPSRWKSNGAL